MPVIWKELYEDYDALFAAIYRNIFLRCGRSILSNAPFPNSLDVYHFDYVMLL